MPTKTVLVATSVGDGTFVERYAAAIRQQGAQNLISIIVIPDMKTPPALFHRCADARQEGLNILCPTVEEQDKFLDHLGTLHSLIPHNSDNRRNVGFLMALEQGCDILITIDDDNFPRADSAFFAGHSFVNQEVELPAVHSSSGWFNVCRLMEIEPIVVFPRGFPYRYRGVGGTERITPESGIVHINVGLWLGHPDVDAITCLAVAPHASALRDGPVLLGADTWTPINTQNTALSRDAIGAYYFLRMGYPILGIPIDRDGDIFSGYFVQACARHLGYRIRVGTPATDHVRNAHNYLRDLSHELACIWILEDITDWLREVKLEGDTYAETYLSLASMLEEAVEKFSGFIWTDATRAYFHYVAYCMRAWVKAVKTLT